MIDLETKEKTKIPGSQGYLKSRLSPNGKFIAPVFSDGKSIGLFDRASQKWSVVAHASVPGPVAWSPDSQYMYFQDLLEDGEPAHSYNVRSHETGFAMECRPFLEGGVSMLRLRGFPP
jgi:hypothetical protein